MDTGDAGKKLGRRVQLFAKKVKTEVSEEKKTPSLVLEAEPEVYCAGDLIRSNWVVSDLHDATECMRALQIHMLNLEVAKEEHNIALSKRNELEESVLIANAQHRDTQRVVIELEARIEALQVQQKVDWAEVG